MRVHVTDVTPSPGRTPFHRGTTFVEGLGVTGPGTAIVQPGAFIAVRAALDAEQAVPGFSINLADDFTQERQIGVIGDTNRAYRNRSLSNVVPQAGLKLPAGNTFSFSATNSS